MRYNRLCKFFHNSGRTKFSAPLNPFAKQLNQYLECVLAGAS
jgi:hypothetical protein